MSEKLSMDEMFEEEEEEVIPPEAITLSEYGLKYEDYIVEGYYKKFPEASKIIHNGAPTTHFFSYYIETCPKQDLEVIDKDKLNKGQTEALEKAIENKADEELGSQDAEDQENIHNSFEVQNKLLQEANRVLESQVRDAQRSLDKKFKEIIALQIERDGLRKLAKGMFTIMNTLMVVDKSKKVNKEHLQIIKEVKQL